MKQENKELLLKDLCARLSYGVIGVHLIGNKVHNTCSRLTGLLFDSLLNSAVDTFKPYLRSMLSMTEEEYKEFYKVVFESQNIDGISASTYVSDWLISKQFDVRGLIEKGLALEASEDMYK